MNNRRFIRPETFNILGSPQNTTSYTSASQSAESDSGSTQSRWERFKTKAKNVWKIMMSVAEDVKNNIIPIVVGAGHFLTALAVFINQKGGRTAWAS